MTASFGSTLVEAIAGRLPRARRHLAPALIVACCVLPAVGTAAAAVPGDTYPISDVKLPADAIPGGDSGAAGMGYSSSDASADGRYVAFLSTADSLASGANLDANNVFRKDRTTGAVVLVSRANGANGTGITGRADGPKISADGNLIVFITDERLDPADTDDMYDAYLRNVSAGTTALVTPGVDDDVQQIDLSADGQYIAFSTYSALVAGDTNAKTDVYRRRISDGNIQLVSRIPALANAGNESSYYPAISGDGRWVAFSSSATDLVAGFTDNNGPFSSDTFARDMASASTVLVSARWNSATNGANDDSQEPVIAGTPGAEAELTVAYASYATDVAAPGVDTDSASTVYVRKMSALPSVLVSQSSSGVNADSRAHTPSISDNGQRVVFSSDATNLGAGADYYGVYVRDITAGTTSLASARNEYAVFGVISANGGLALWTEAGGGTPDSDPVASGVFARTLPGGSVSLVSRPPGTKRFLLPGAVTDTNETAGALLSQDGRYAVINGVSSLLPGSTPPQNQIYRRDLATGDYVLASRASGAAGEVSRYATTGTISADGNRIAFETASQLDPADTDDRMDVYVRDLSAATTVLASRADGANGADSNDSSRESVISGNGRYVAFSTESTNLGSPSGGFQIYVRDLQAGTTVLASRADGPAGTIGDGASADPVISDDGGKVAYSSYSTNLDPDDPANSQSVYLRDLATDDTSLISRQTGNAGTNLADYSNSPRISGDGNVIAFETGDPMAATEAGAWPAGERQVVGRKLTDGANFLISRVAGGAPADAGADNASLSRDGGVIAFESSSENLKPGLAGEHRDSVFIRNTATGAISAPPAFGPVQGMFDFGSHNPSLSADGHCLSLLAIGHNAISGVFGDFPTRYLHVVSGTCDRPPVTGPVPKLSKVSLKPKKFAVSKKATAKSSAQASAKKKKRKRSKKGTKVRFTLDQKATVVFFVERRGIGRKVKGKCNKVKKWNRKKKKCVRFTYIGRFTRKNLAAGARVVPFSGRIGKRKLAPGRYRMRLRAANQNGPSKEVKRPFTVLRR